MDTPVVQAITSALAPVVLVSAAGLLFIGVQTKNLTLADRVRGLLGSTGASGPGARPAAPSSRSSSAGSG